MLLKQIAVSKYIMISDDGEVISSSLKPHYRNISVQEEDEISISFIVKNFLNSFYCYWIDDTLIISGSIKSIFDFTNGRLELDSDARDYFLESGFIFSPWTIYENIFLVCPGFVYSAKNGSFTISVDKKDTAGNPFRLTELKKLLTDTLTDQIGSHPLTCLTLSGRLDSLIM